MLLLPCRKIRAGGQREYRAKGGGACSDSIWCKDPLDHFTMKTPNLSSTKSKNLANKIKNKLIFFLPSSVLLIRCMDIQGRGQREYRAKGDGACPNIIG